VHLMLCVSVCVIVFTVFAKHRHQYCVGLDSQQTLAMMVVNGLHPHENSTEKLIIH